VRRLTIRAAAAALLALSLSGCIDSSGPILQDAQPLFGENLRLQFYTLSRGFVDEPEQAAFKWDGTRYAHVSGGMTDVTAFTTHRLQAGAYIIQSEAAKRPRIYEYAVAQKLTDGVFQAIAIDEDDAAAPTRAAYCKRVDESHCRIETRRQLFAFARATAVRRKGEGGLVLRLADTVPEPPRQGN
jgi:hypothetical protein